MRMTHLGTSLYRINQARREAANKWQATRETLKIQEIPIMSNQLFVEVSVEEQELVSGGIVGALAQLATLKTSDIAVLGPVASTNTPAGSTFTFGGASRTITLESLSSLLAGITV